MASDLGMDGLSAQEARELRTATEQFHAVKLKRARDAKDFADQNYMLALLAAIQDGVSNNKIAKMVGVSETAIRKWRGRRAV